MGYIGGLYTGLSYISFPVDRHAGTLAFFEEQLGLADSLINSIVSADNTQSVVNITYVPSKYFTVSSDSSANYEPKSHTVSVIVPKTIGGYTPRNKKLFTYPYTFLCVDTLNDEQIYRWENFFNKKTVTINQEQQTLVEFENTGFLTAIPVVMSTPYSYKSLNYLGDYILNPTETIMLDKFPQIAMNVDSFRAYVANGSLTNSLLGAVGDVAVAGVAASVGNPARAISSAVGFAQGVNNTVHALMKGDQARGNQSPAPHVANRAYNFYYKKVCVKAEYARMVDGFFDRFGYATNQLKVPNTHVRENWTYTKTNDCAIVGTVPVDDMNKIKSIFNNGITFWNNPYAVGDYSLSNRCLSEIPTP